MPAWHAEVIALSLRRYPGARTPEQAADAFAAGEPYDGTGLARIDIGRASIGPLLIGGVPMSRTDHRQLEALLRQHGARELVITRHGQLLVRGDAAVGG
jgi:hypothetical protein